MHIISCSNGKLVFQLSPKVDKNVDLRRVKAIIRKMSIPTPCPDWIAQVQGHSFDLTYWEQSLKQPFDPVCEQIPHGDSTIWGLRSSTFDQLQSAEEVRAQATILIARLNGALRAQCDAEPLTLQGVVHIDNNGNLHFTAFLESHSRSRSMGIGTLETRDTDGNLVPPLPPEPSLAQKWIQVAEQNDDVADMLIFAGRATDWFDIYKALELAQSLMGGRPGRKLNALIGGVSDEFERMWRTANMHRHARSKDPPTIPMTLIEATSLLPVVIRMLLAHLAH